MKIVTKRTVEKECWNLDYSFIVWLNNHLIVYKDTASKHIDLTYHKIRYKKVVMTQEDVLYRMIDLSNFIRYEAKDSCFNIMCNIEELEKAKDELLDLFKRTFFWWWW